MLRAQTGRSGSRVSPDSVPDALLPRPQPSLTVPVAEAQLWESSSRCERKSHRCALRCDEATELPDESSQCQRSFGKKEHTYTSVTGLP